MVSGIVSLMKHFYIHYLLRLNTQDRRKIEIWIALEMFFFYVCDLDFASCFVNCFLDYSWRNPLPCFFNQLQGAAAVAENKRSPADFLKAVLGRPVNVRLNTGTDYRGMCHVTRLFSGCSIFAQLSCCLQKQPLWRCLGMLGWVYEHCYGTNWGVCGWAVEVKVWRLFYSGKQWRVLLRDLNSFTTSFPFAIG